MIAIMSYMSSNKQLIWGDGDQETLDALDNLKPRGIWLVLASGDGRYLPELLKTVDQVVVTDHDRSLLEHLRTIFEANPRIRFKEVDITTALPFGSDSFDGVFCTGALHLFTPEVLESIAHEIDRVLRKGGVAFFDVATDICRTYPRGKPGKRQETETLYSSDTATRLVPRLFPGYDIESKKSTFHDDLSEKEDFYTISTGNFLLFLARKRT